MLEEADPFTQIGSSHAHPGAVGTTTSSKWCSSSRQVAQGQLHTTSEIDLCLNPTPVAAEPTQPVMGF